MYDPKSTGSVEGTGAEIIVELGFKPGYVKLMNIDDAGGKAPSLEHIAGMAAATGFKTIDAGDATSRSLLAAAGITLYDGDSTHKAGFKIGTDGDINVDGETICYLVAR